MKLRYVFMLCVMLGITITTAMAQDYSKEFESYLQTRRSNATYNGIELETAGWQKELFGFKETK